ncbi:MAG: DUF4919 domain-containing protein [Chloroflexi bacterium]|nr:DUF4919 domain-containing protein [Chloroflexota bacterium]
MTDVNFAELLAAAERDPHGTDFVQLRHAYVADSTYQPASHLSQAKLQGMTNNVQDVDELALRCQKLLESNPMDLEIRLMLDFAYSELEQHDLAARQHTFVSKMLDAIWNHGDGKSFETAWHVVSVAEEYTLLSIMGYQMQRQDLMEQAGRWYDVLTCTSRKNANTGPVTFYFDITDPFSYLNRTFG